MREHGIGTVEVEPEVQERFMREMYERSKRSVWETGGCRSYYQDQHGRNTGLWPSWSWDYRARTRRFDPQSYRLTPRRQAAAHAVA